MTDVHDDEQEQEPLGIVISRGSRDEEAPRFSAYIWSQVPETTASAHGVKAA